MESSVYFVSFLILYEIPMISANFSDLPKICDHFGISFYNDINCSPKFIDIYQLCPHAFNCSNYKYQEGSCSYQNKIYKNGEVIKESNGLDRNCKCSVKDGKSMIDCEIKSLIDAASNELKKIEEMCKMNKTLLNNNLQTDCNDLMKQSTTCQVNGKTLKEGDKFEANASCIECMCRKGYKGLNIPPFCYNKPCETVLTKLDDIGNKCAPVYVDEEAAIKVELPEFKVLKNKPLCCPSKFLCGRNASVVTLTSSRINDTTDTCSFGNTTFRAGAVYKVSYVNRRGETRDVVCICNMPPLPTCFEPPGLYDNPNANPFADYDDDDDDDDDEDIFDDTVKNQRKREDSGIGLYEHVYDDYDRFKYY